MTRPDPRLAMDRIRSRPPPGDDYPVELAPAGPEDRGQVGRVRIRTENGAGPQLRDVWWLRCPWCREMIELAAERIFMDAGVLRVIDPVMCLHCEAIYTIGAGRARRLECAGRPGVTSDPTTASVGKEGT